jgi:hypothetical protein
MIRLKLNLPEATVNYDEHGALVGFPADHAPSQIKAFGMPFEIVGYTSKTDFLAYSLSSTARKLSVSEQLSLLHNLGFKTVPYFEIEDGRGNELIAIKNQYSMYGAVWISLPSGTEFKVPELAHVNSVKWIMRPDQALAMEVTTDKGVFEIVDMRMVAYYQPGCTAKVWKDELQPMNTAPIVSPAPAFCPKCNNPLKRVQIYKDLPMFYKCTNSMCTMLVLDEEPIEEEPEVITEEDTFLGTDTEQPVAEDTVPDSELTDAEAVPEDEEPEAEEPAAPVVCYVDTAKVDAEDVDKLVEAGKIQVTSDIEEAECVLVKSKYSVSKDVRAQAKELDKELRPVSDFE